MRSRKLFIAVIGMLIATLGTAPNAFASHTLRKVNLGPHESIPDNPAVIRTVKANCTVGLTSSVLIGPLLRNGVSALQPLHNHYGFLLTSISCRDTPGNTGFLGTYLVRAGDTAVRGSGGTDGPNTARPLLAGLNELRLLRGNGLHRGLRSRGWLLHGETSATGWSHSSGYSRDFTDNSCEAVGVADPDSNNNKGNIHILNRANGKTARGWVMFIRAGSVVDAWGYFVFLGGLTAYFRGSFQFTPKHPLTLIPKVKHATLSGTANVGDGLCPDPISLRIERNS